jgi:hypothetical protein
VKIRELLANVKGFLGVTRLDPEVEAEMSRLGMKPHEKALLREVWSKQPKREEFPTCLGCATLFDPDFKPEKLPAPTQSLCSVCVKAQKEQA